MHDAAAMGSYPRDLFPALDIITWAAGGGPFFRPCWFACPKAREAPEEQRSYLAWAAAGKELKDGHDMARVVGSTFATSHEAGMCIVNQSLTMCGACFCRARGRVSG
jgi:hypothetical protein